MSALSVLVVTNDPDLRSLLRVCLKGNGHQLDMAENGLVAVSKLNQTKYDVILLDYDRAEIGGMTVLQHIHDHHHIPIVLMLEHDSPFAAQPLTTFGVQACLVKPFDPQAVEQILNSSPVPSMHGPARRVQGDPRGNPRGGDRRSVSSNRDGQLRAQEMAPVRKGR